jgi:hypothetical protein
VRADGGAVESDGGATRASDVDPVEDLGRVGAGRQDRTHRVLGGRAPHIVEHDVHVGGHSGQCGAGGLDVGGERHDVVCAVIHQSVQSRAVAPGGDDASGPEVPGDLDGHGAGVAGRAQDEHRLSRGEGHSGAQDDPRRHERIHGGGDDRGVGAPGHGDRAGGVE